MGFLAARERHIDEYLAACLAGGIQQLVILGAGFDARAYRFEEFKRGVKAFEVDHPASQQAKLEKLKKIFGQAPPHVVYVPIDFNIQSLAQRLLECGYDENRKTLFIWQGVTQYLTPSAVDDTLAFIANNSGEGSSVIFDYMYSTLLDGSIKHGEVTNMRSKRWLSGEDFSFGIADGAVTDFLEHAAFIKSTRGQRLFARHLFHRDQRQTQGHVRICDCFGGRKAKRCVTRHSCRNQIS
jgi:methyltransferase (TIGR00027 family)